MRNIYACLVHENPDVIRDLVRNLTYLDPESTVLLYNGSSDSGLLADAGTYASGVDVLVHPDPAPQSWGKLHQFAIDCMRHALDSAEFRTLTIVDSDQLATRPGYSDHIAGFLSEHPQVGMLGSTRGPQPRPTRCPPAAVAVREFELWRPFLRRFEQGERRFPYWTFWPGTVFTADAAREVVALIDDDTQLAHILERSQIWASEEVVLPTLVALLGFEVAVNPCSQQFVKYRVSYATQDVEQALASEQVFWIHPVPRRYDDPLRARIRSRFDHYQAPVRPQLLLRAPILKTMQGVEGWLSDDEADLLIAATAKAVAEGRGRGAVVEAGSYCGRTTVVLGQTLKSLGVPAKVHSIDPHDGVIGAADAELEHTGPTRERFQANIAAAGIHEIVEVVQQAPSEADWHGPISLLVIDGLHDYEHVARDFARFEPWLVPEALVAFHDYAYYFPGVVRFVDELLAEGDFKCSYLAGTMIVLQRQTAALSYLARNGSADRAAEPRPVVRNGGSRNPASPAPMVTCLMPTYDRHAIVPRAVEYFLRQDHTNAELIVIDDSPEPLTELLPRDPRVRHVRLERRQTIGAKRNLGARLARGSLLANWDDDDWYAPWRLSYQVGRMCSGGFDVCGLDRLLYLDATTGQGWRYSPPAGMRAWLADPTMVFTTSFWQRNPFPDTSMGIDCRLLWSGRPKRLLAMEREEFFVGIIHARNTSPKDTGHAVWSPYSETALRELMGEDLLHHVRATRAEIPSQN